MEPFDLDPIAYFFVADCEAELIFSRQSNDPYEALDLTKADDRVPRRFSHQAKRF